MERIQRSRVAKFVIPTILSQCCFFLFTVIDGIFVGRGVGSDALGAVNLALPFVMTVNALFVLASIGGVTVTAVRLGRGDEMGANAAFMHAAGLATILAVVLMLIGTTGAGGLAHLFGATPTYYQMVKDYLFWYSVFLVPSCYGILLQNFCRNDNSPGLVSVAIVIGTLLNIFLDWLFVFPLKMGVSGAAIATGISQTVSFVLVLPHFALKKGALRIGKTACDPSLLKKIAGRGTPEMVAQFAVPVTTFCLNYVLLRQLNDQAVNAFSILNYVASFSVAIFMGSSEGLQPLFGQAYGARNEVDLRYLFRCGLLINTIGSLIIYVLLFIVGEPVCVLFGADAATTRETVLALPQFGWSFLVISVNTMISAYLYSTKRTKYALVINICRSFVFNSVIITLLPMLFGSWIVWNTPGIAESLTLVVAISLLKVSERRGIAFA